MVFVVLFIDSEKLSSNCGWLEIVKIDDVKGAKVEQMLVYCGTCIIILFLFLFFALST